MASFLRQTLRQNLASLQKPSTQSLHSINRACAALGQRLNVTPQGQTQPTYVSVGRMIHTTTPLLLPDNGGDNVIIPPRDEVYKYKDNIKSMTNEELSDPTTIPGFSSLVHSPPRDRSSTPRNALMGKVVSDKMDKTVNVEVDRYKIIPKYRKRMKYSKKFMAHDEEEVCKEGDLVMIVPCQRISKRKHFKVYEVIRQKGVL